MKNRTEKIRLITDDSGFTLIEILIVVVIIGLLASLVAPNLFKNLGKSKKKIAAAQIEMLASAVQTYMLDVGSCPESLGELIHSDNPKWKGPYLSKEIIPTDPWGHDFIYRCPGEHGAFDIISLGADGKEGGTGENEDIVSWK